MKKRWLSLLMLVCFSIGFISGCKETEESSINKLNIDGSDVVLKIGEKEIYTADDLFADMLNTEIGAQTAYEKILKMVVESTIGDDPNITASWELMLDSFETNVKNTALSSGIKEDEARKQLLAQEGYASIEEKKDAYFYSVKLSMLQDKYWDTAKYGYYDSYFESRMPYYIKHALVKTSYTAARGPYSTTIESSDATALYNVYNWLVKGYDFSQIMNEYSEDTGSSSDATGYHMDLTTSFVTEFLHGVFAFDALLKNKTLEVVGITETAEYYKGEGNNDFNFGIINASDVEVLGKNASNSDTKSITMYEKVYNDETQKDEEKNVGSISSAYGSSYALNTRTIIFNQTFNNPGISVIAYDLDDDNAKNTTTININGEPVKVLTDEKGNIVFVVCARGSSNDLWIHFLTINVSPFDTFESTNEKHDAKLFFSIDKEATIKDMVEVKKAELVEDGISGTDLENAISAYTETLNKYKTYVDEKVKNNDTVANRNKIIEELEGYVKTYAKRGITSGAVAGKDQFLTYDMVEHYMKDENGTVKIEIVNDSIKTMVTNYIAAQKALIDFSAMNSIVAGWNEYYNLVTFANSDEIVDKKIPMECSYSVNGDSNRGSLCKYTYGVGFEIVMRYMDGSTELTVADDYKYYRIGETFTLPTPEKAGYVFAGWYTDSALTQKVDLDTMRSSTNNKTQLYAKWTEVNS